MRYFSSAVTAAAAALGLASGAAAICYPGEAATKMCYTAPTGTPQNLSTGDVAAAASFLRAYGQQDPAHPIFWTMTAAAAAGCGEWSVYQTGTVLVLAKHINDNVNSSVLYADIANTIDGGLPTTAASRAASLLSCTTSGGSMGVAVNASNPAYNTTAYVQSGYTPDGILIKLVHSASS